MMSNGDKPTDQIPGRASRMGSFAAPVKFAPFLGIASTTANHRDLLLRRCLRALGHISASQQMTSIVCAAELAIRPFHIPAFEEFDQPIDL